SFNLTAGALLWPVVFITTDLINEYFGKPGVRLISYFTALLIAYAFLAIFLTMQLAPADFWLETNKTDNAGNPFNIQYAYTRIFGQGLRIIVGSLPAFLLGQFVDVFVFQRLRRATGARMTWLRATGSTLVSQLVDCFCVLFSACCWTFTHARMAAIGVTRFVYTCFIALLLPPLICLGHYWIDRYLGEAEAMRSADEASHKS